LLPPLPANVPPSLRMSHTHQVLTQSNFQGPPGASAECRCANAQAASPSFPSVLQVVLAMGG
jgi:hypothetical protein